MSLISAVLNLYIWLVICILLWFLFAIARFYEKKSGRRSFYMIFLVAAVLFALGAFRYLFFMPAVVGDLWGDLLRFSGALIVSGFGFFLLKLMTGRRS